MTDLDWLPPANQTLAVPTPRRHRHVWTPLPGANAPQDTMYGCLQHAETVYRDETRARRGKSSRRLGNDGERRSEKRYGLQKIGERGEITDLRGTIWKVQQKTSRRAVPATWRAIFSQLDATKDGREAAIIVSFVKQGFPTQDFWIVRGDTILTLLGRDEPGGA